MKYRSRKESCASYGKLLFSFPWCLFQFSSLEVGEGCRECITGCGVRRDTFVPARICMSKVVVSCFPANTVQEIKPLRGFKGFLLNMFLRMQWFDSQRRDDASLMQTVISRSHMWHKQWHKRCVLFLSFVVWFCLLSQNSSERLWSSYGSVFRSMDPHYRSTLCCTDSHLTTAACAVCSHATVMQNSSITTLIFAPGHWPMDGGALLF